MVENEIVDEVPPASDDEAPEKRVRKAGYRTWVELLAYLRGGCACMSPLPGADETGRPRLFHSRSRVE